jgi:hypothetical protein
VDIRRGLSLIPAIRARLSAYAGNLAAHLRQSLPAATLEDAIGGAAIDRDRIEAELAALPEGRLRQTALPYQDASGTLTEWTEIPSQYKPTLRIVHSGLDRVYSSDAIYGRRLTLTYDGQGRPELKIDGVPQATGTAMGN